MSAVIASLGATAADNWFALVLSIVTIAYLVIVLVFPERF